MTSTSSQQKNDCVIVALSNALSLPYDDIAKQLPKPGKNGLTQDKWLPIIQAHGWIQLKSIPRRGQDKITGIVRLISSKRCTGHLVYMKNGIVFDAFHPNGLPIKEYQQRSTKSHIQMIWIKTTPVISSPLIDTVNGDFDFSDLSKLTS